jgi:hypothetical protein
VRVSGGVAVGGAMGGAAPFAFLAHLPNARPASPTREATFVNVYERVHAKCTANNRKQLVGIFLSFCCSGAVNVGNVTFRKFSFCSHSVVHDILLLFCCYCLTLQHRTGFPLNVKQL